MLTLSASLMLLLAAYILAAMIEPEILRHKYKNKCKQWTISNSAGRHM